MYYGNEGLSLAWNRIKMCQVALFITITNFFEILKQTKFIYIPKNTTHEVLILKKSTPGTTIHNYF